MRCGISLKPQVNVYAERHKGSEKDIFAMVFKSMSILMEVMPPAIMLDALGVVCEVIVLRSNPEMSHPSLIRSV